MAAAAVAAGLGVEDKHGLRGVVVADTQVLLGDTMGELMLWYGVADACFVGGSLIPRGGHNPLEVLCLEKPLICGPHTQNFEQLYTAVETAGGRLLALNAEAAFQHFRQLLEDKGAAWSEKDWRHFLAGYQLKPAKDAA